MKDDLLREATHALRQLPSPSTPFQVNETRRRILGSLHEGDRRRHQRWAFALPLAAVFIGSTAWAGASGKLPEIVKSLASVFTRAGDNEPVQQSPSLPPVSSTRTSGQANRSVAPQPKPAAAASDDTEVSEEARPTADAPVKPSPPPVRPNPPPPRQVQVPREVDAKSEAFDLYKRAHRAHFQKHDCVAAISGYEAYLNAAPQGRFRLEASYNRALCLVRMGHREQARQALRPFAEGRFGTYRQSEAERLLDALAEGDNP